MFIPLLSNTGNNLPELKWTNLREEVRKTGSKFGAVRKQRFTPLHVPLYEPVVGLQQIIIPVPLLMNSINIIATWTAWDRSWGEAGFHTLAR